MIKTTGKEKNYELNINGIMDISYTYGNERLTNERFTGGASVSAGAV